MTSTVDITSDTPHRQHYGLTFGVLALSGATYALLQSLVAPALPEIQRDLHTTATAVAWVLTAFLLSASIFTPILGRLGDMFGKERMLVVALVTLAFGSLVAALASSIGLLIIGRVIQGAGGAIFPLAFGIIRDEFPRERVAQGIALISAILGIGGGLGIVLAGPIVDAFSYHWLFWFPLAATVIATIATFFFVPESPVRSPGRVNWVGAALLSSWLVAVLVGDQPGLDMGLGRPAHHRPVRARHRAAGRVGHGGEPILRAPRRHDDDAHPRRLDRQRRGVPGRRGHVQLVHPHPAVRRDAGVRGLRLRVERHRGGAVPAARDARDAVRQPAGGTHDQPLRRAPAARARIAGDGPRVRVPRAGARRAVGVLRRRRAARHRHRPGLRVAREPHRRGRAPGPDGRRDRHEHRDADRRRLRGQPRSSRA